MGWIRAHRGISIILAVAVAAAGAFLFFYWFGFQNAVIDERVDEAAPTAPISSSPAAPDDAADPREEPEAHPEGPVTLSRGRFQDLAHHTSGTALLIELPDGRQVIRLEELDTLNGPDLKVYLSDAPAGAAEDAFDDRYESLGALKGNQGNQNYDVPRGIDAGRFSSVVIWCERFSVGFGVASLEA